MLCRYPEFRQLGPSATPSSPNSQKIVNRGRHLAAISFMADRNVVWKSLYECVWIDLPSASISEPCTIPQVPVQLHVIQLGHRFRITRKKSKNHEYPSILHTKARVTPVVVVEGPCRIHNRGNQRRKTTCKETVSISVSFAGWRERSKMCQR
jgi:hypothetical protein